MNMELKPINTRFRAYQLGEPGSSFSYFADGHFTLIEAKLTRQSSPSLASELKACGRTTIDTLRLISITRLRWPTCLPMKPAWRTNAF